MTLDDAAAEIVQFDPSDAYHENEGDIDEHSYYAAIDRCIALLKGKIADWTDHKE